MSIYHYLACDVGAETARVVLGTLANGQLELEEIHSFPTPTIPGELNGAGRWDLPALERELFIGIAKAAGRNLPIAGISATSHGLDYVLLDRHDRPVESPSHHASNGARGTAIDRLLRKVAPAQIYAETGIPVHPLH